MAAERVVRRGRICARQITAGPGTCSYWYDSCPEDVRHCFNRHIRELGGTLDQAGAEAWARERDKAVNPEPALL